MKTMLTFLASGLLLVLLLTACSRQPAREIAAAKSAVDAAMSEGAEKYAPEESAKVNDELTAAMNEVKAEDAKFLRNYTAATERLVKVKAAADSLRAGLSTRKEEARQKALSAQSGALTAVNKAAELLERPGKGSGAKADVPAARTDLRALQDAMTDVRELIAAEDYYAASDKAEAVRNKAVLMSEQARQTPACVVAKAGPKKK